MDDLKALMAEAVARVPGMALKGKKMPYTAVNGNMFAFIAPDGEICLRFGEARRAELAELWGKGPVMQYNAVMRGYVAVPNEELRNLPAFYAESHAFALTLNPKPTKR